MQDTMTWNQFKLFLLRYGLRAEHDELWARWAYCRWGQNMHSLEHLGENEEFDDQFVHHMMDLTDLGSRLHPAVVPDDELVGLSDQATAALDSYTPEQVAEDREDELLEDLWARDASHADKCGCSKCFPRKQAETRRLLKERSKAMRLERRDTEAARRNEGRLDQ